MRILIIFSALCLVVTNAQLNAKNNSGFSWGKSGVTLQDYVKDGTECAETSRYVTTYIKPATLRHLDALSAAQLLDSVLKLGAGTPEFNAIGLVANITALRSANDIARRTNTFSSQYESIISFDVRDQLQAVLGKCLLERGYARIWLTKSQQATLRRLKRHSRERTAYLYSIGSNAEVMAEQQVKGGIG